MYCRECGNEIKDKAIICPNCGCATGNPMPKTQNLESLPSKKHRGFGFYHKGRASRSTFWIHTILMIAISTAVYVLTIIVIGAAISPESLSEEAAVGYIVFGGIFLFAYTIATLYYGLMLAIRRVHDFGSTGWLTGLLFIPNIGIIPWIVFGCIPSEEGANKYGTEPDVI